MSDTLLRINRLEESLAKLRAEYANSWALHTKDDFELGFARDIRNEIQGTISKWAFGAVVLLLGAGALFIKYSVSQVFRDENEKLVTEFSEKYDRQLERLQDNFEWRRFHDYGKNYVYLSELYLDSPVEPLLKTERIVGHLNTAEQYFLRALQHGDRHSSTYWELGELYYSYPLKLNVPRRLDPPKAIEHYGQAANRYTQIEIGKGWRAECYIRMAEAYLHMVKATEDGVSAQAHHGKAVELLNLASSDYAGMEDQSGPNNQKNMRRLQALLVDVRNTPKKVGRAGG